MLNKEELVIINDAPIIPENVEVISPFGISIYENENNDNEINLFPFAIMTLAFLFTKKILEK